jgi:hypothetical protein
MKAYPTAARVTAARSAAANKASQDEAVQPLGVGVAPKAGLQAAKEAALKAEPWAAEYASSRSAEAGKASQGDAVNPSDSSAALRQTFWRQGTPLRGPNFRLQGSASRADAASEGSQRKEL